MQNKKMWYRKKSYLAGPLLHLAFMDIPWKPKMRFAKNIHIGENGSKL